MFLIAQQAQKNLQKVAIIANNQSFTYQELLQKSKSFASYLLQAQTDLSETRVAFMVSPSFDYVRVQWAIWQAGGIAVPLCITHPLASLRYVIEDTQSKILVVSPEYETILAPLAAELAIRFIVLGSEPTEQNFSEILIDDNRGAMILYTSGTTNLPKGVVSTHRNLNAQVSTLIDAWQYSSADHLLCILPLHHVHGIINVVSCTLWAGGTVEFMDKFSPEKVFEWMSKPNIQKVFMAVPTIYFKLIAYYETLGIEEQKQLSQEMQKFRLMISGSAALPVSVMDKWLNISGHKLLERYGMTEIGMAISNPYQGERKAGYIGQPLKGVEIRLVDENNQVVAKDEAGEIQVRGANVFKEYWQKEKATQESFTTDGWFKTGDVAIVEEGYYRILGRNSVDIIKSGGYKISALEIEEVLRTYPEIDDCSVVGIEDEEWGELVVAAIIPKVHDIDIQLLTSWLKEKMPHYRVPRKYKIVTELPRNAMGKVTKNDVKKLFL